jgi:hypothetical protein
MCCVSQMPRSAALRISSTRSRRISGDSLRFNKNSVCPKITVRRLFNSCVNSPAGGATVSTGPACCRDRVVPSSALDCTRGSSSMTGFVDTDFLIQELGYKQTERQEGGSSWAGANRKRRPHESIPREPACQRETMLEVTRLNWIFKRIQAQGTLGWKKINCRARETVL